MTALRDRVPVRLGAFATALLVSGGAAWAVGAAYGSPVAPAAPHGGHAAPAPTTGTPAPSGLAASGDGLTLVPATSTLATGTQEFRFAVRKDDGSALTSFSPTHERDLHLVVVRRDLTRFQHLHPTRDASGTWSVPLTLDAPGPYRVYADFAPAGGAARALAVDVVVPGDYQPVADSGARRVSSGGGYTVTASGDLVPGTESTLTFDVRRGAAPVTDLQPYLGAHGHLVLLRESDLAYLHVHPEEGPPGPQLRFGVTAPTPGRYAGFLDTRHRDRVRTAVVRLAAGGAS